LIYTVRFSPFAKEDKKEIKTYLSKFYPENTNYRRMFVGNYIVFYKINDTEKQIDIYRVLRASWDLPKYL
jgi:plasmid stabilization system protein ParE